MEYIILNQIKDPKSVKPAKSIKRFYSYENIFFKEIMPLQGCHIFKNIDKFTIFISSVQQKTTSKLSLEMLRHV